MRNFLYALRQVFRLKWGNLIKLLSLTLGIAISGIFMCKVAYEQSYDDFHPDVDRLNIVYMHYNINGKDHGFQRQCLAPIALELRAKMPNVVAATRFQGYSPAWYLKDNEPMSLKVAWVDTSFFDVIQLRVLSGNPKQILSARDGMMLSRKAAERLFAKQDPIGKQITRDENTYTIQGVFEDLPNNSHLEPMDGLVAGYFREDWNGGDNSFTYFRTSDDATPEELTAEVNKLLAPRFEGWKTDRIMIDFKVDNIREEFASKVKETNLMVSLLVLIMILVAGFNFALISISSLSSRAKEVGVHKASGANVWGVFWMILWECIIYVVLALILSAVIACGFKSQIETMIGLYSDVLVMKNLWGIGLVLLLTVCVGGILPATLFARIPVTQVFRRFTDNKSKWKMALLFVQFASTMFVISFLGVMVGQYNTMMTHDLGYDYKNLIYTKLSDMKPSDYSLISNELKRLKCVEDVTFSSGIIPGAGGGFGVQDMETGENLFSSASISIDSNFVKLHGIELLSGSAAPRPRNGTDTTNITVESMVVNAEFIRRLGITGNQLGDFKMFNEVFHIAGVVKNFQTASLKKEVAPLMFLWRNWDGQNCVVTIKLTNLTPDNIKAVSDRLRELFPLKGIEIKSYPDTIRWEYADTEMFRNGVVVLTLFLIIISILGIVGYISNEIARRKREIAVRKVFGSSVTSVVVLMMKNLLVLAVVAAVISTPLAYFMSSMWQSDYIVKMPLYWWIFASSILFIIFAICLCVLVQTWRIAKENPARSVMSD